MEVRLTEGLYVAASTVACLDILSDFVAWRRRLGPDGAVARQRRFGAGATDIPGSRGLRDTDSRRRGTGIPGSRCGRDADSKPRGADGGATVPASNPQGHRA